MKTRKRIKESGTIEAKAWLVVGRRGGKSRAFPGVRGFLRRAYGPGWALVGDAGYFKDPLTAHGITDALRDAELLARAVAAGREDALAEYQATRDRLVKGLFDITDRIASFEWSLEEAKVDHLVLSKEMNAEVELLKALDGDSLTAPGGADGNDAVSPSAGAQPLPPWPGLAAQLAHQGRQVLNHHDPR